MYLLALHEDSNSNLTLFKDGEVLFSAAEERFSRTKHQAGFPSRAIKMLWHRYGISLRDIDVIVCANKYHCLPRILWDKFPTFEHSFLGPLQKLSLYYQDIVSKNPLAGFSAEAFNRIMLRLKFGRAVSITDHHLAHAYSAYMTSGFNKALAITSDNFGDGLSSAVFTCEDGRCKFLYGSSALNSPGQFYGEIAQLLGFHPLMAGKMTGLAAYGDPSRAYGAIAGLFSITEDRKNFILPSLIFKHPSAGIYRKLRKYNKEDIAAAAQKRFEDIMLDYVREAIRVTGISSLALAGGVYGNVRLNQKISELNEVREIFIHPAMNDQGISLGAGLKYLAENAGLRPKRLDNVYWGPEYDNTEIEKALKQAGAAYEYHRDIEKATAQLLKDGKVVARYSGRLEYGPRALGNRSILYQATDRSVNDWLNKKLRRSEFMPFAPVTLSEFAADCYKDIEKVKNNAKFMTISVDCTDLMKKVSPGVVHLDGTARPQLIEEKDNPGYYRIVKEYYKLTGIPSLINTSFNMHEEPIINTPPEAIRAFKTAGLDYLAIGSYLVGRV